MQESLWVRIYHAVLYLLAFIVVFCAIIFTTTRLLTPVFNSYQPAFEKWTSQLIDAPVKVNKVSLGWHGIEPEMLLSGVKVYKPDSKKTEILVIKKLYVALDVWRSLLNFQLKPSLITLNGIHLVIKQLANGNYQVNDMTLHKQSQNSNLKLNAMLSWLFEQNEIYLKNIDINFNRHDGRQYPLSVQDVSLNNENDYHALAGKISLHSTPSSMGFIVKMNGSLQHWRNSKIAAYVDVKKLNLAHWFPELSDAGYQLSKGEGGFQLWLNWQHNHWTRIVSQLHLYNLSLASKKLEQPYRIKGLSTTLRWHSNQKGWDFNAAPVNLITQHHIWPKTQVSANYNPKKGYEIQLSYAQLDDLRRFIAGSNLLKPELQKRLQGLAFSGALRHVTYHTKQNLFEPQAYKLVGQLANVAIKPWKQLPGIQNISGQLAFNNHSGKLTLQSDKTQLNMPALFSHSVHASQLQGQISWRRNNQGWLIQGTGLRLANQDLGIHGEFGLRFQRHQAEPYLSVLAGFSIQDPSLIKHYLPDQVIPKHTLNWLRQAVIEGKPVKGTLMLRGNMQDFPFLKNRGVFQVNTQIDGLTLHFAKGWPEIKNIKADLLFANRSMVIQASSAQMSHGKLGKTSVVLPVIAPHHPTVLMIDTQFSDDAKDLLNLIQETPLKDSIGKNLPALNLTGDLNMGLHLTLPLSMLNKMKVKGELHFLNNRLSFPQWQVALRHIKGQLNFTNQSVQAKDLQADWWGEPVKASVSTQSNNQKKSMTTTVNFSSQMNIPTLQQHFPELKQIPLSGHAIYQGQLTLPLTTQNSQQAQLTVHSNLYGLELNYPEPFGKASQETVPSHATLKFGADKPFHINISLGKRLQAALLFKQRAKQWSFFNGNIRLGEQAAQLPKRAGLVINGKLPEFNYQDWLTYWQQLQRTKHGQSAWLKQAKKLLHSIDVKIDQLKAFSFTFQPAELSVTYHDQDWFVTLNTQPIAGTVTIPEDFPEHQLQADFKRLFLSSKKKSLTQSILPQQIPAFYLKVDDLRYGKRQFGGITLSVAPDKKGLLIKKLTFDSPWLSGVLSGRWQQLKGDQTQTHLKGHLTSDNVTTMLDDLKIKSNLLAEGGYAQFDLQWPGPPYQPHFSQVTGKAWLKLNKGWIVNLNKNTTQKLNLGKLLTLLSVRHLFLQFGDLTHNGYNFDHASGHFKFDDGKITTQDLVFHGAIADIQIKGLMDVVKQWLNFKLTVGVNATSSLPVVATIASGFNPIVGVVTWVADKIAHKEIEKATTYYYQVTGSWHDPKILEQR